MPDLIKIAIVIPVYNRRETTLQGLRSLTSVDQTGLEVRIFIVDDGSNDDSIFHDQFLQRMVRAAQADPRSVIGALLLLWDEPHKVFQVGQVWRTMIGGWHIPQELTAFTVPPEAFEVEGLVGNCTLIPAAAIRECGLMDEKHFRHGWGDAQWFAAMRHKGWKILIEPRAYVWCEPNTYPPPLNTLTPGGVFKVLFRDRRHPLNLKRQFDARWYSAPTKLQGAAAFGVYMLRMAMKTFRLGDPWKGMKDPEQRWKTADRFKDEKAG
jgi:hypothetical protein